MEKTRVAPDTDLARYPTTGYPANNFARYWISGLAGYKIPIRLNKIVDIAYNIYNFVYVAPGYEANET